MISFPGAIWAGFLEEMVLSSVLEMTGDVSDGPVGRGGGVLLDRSISGRGDVNV